MSKIKTNRVRQHMAYVSKRMAELHNEICNDAIQLGYVDYTKREKLFKYQQHYNYYEKL